VSKAIYLHG